MITASGLHKRYGKRHVLNGASFSVEAAEMVAVLGENGSGKSTLLKLLAGSLRPDRGSITRAGRIGFCPQDCVLYPYLTPDEHIELFGEAANVSRPIRQRQAAGFYERFNFGRYRDQIVEGLSGGTKQKLNLTLALLASPPILLLDEPYNGFDVETYHAFLDWSAEAKLRLGTSIVVVTHIAFDRERFDRIMTLRDGKVWAAA